jgi:hypothetical protein
MTIHELNDRLTALHAPTVTPEQYPALEIWYIALDLDKDVFAAVVKAVGVEVLNNRVKHAEFINTAVDEYQARQRYKANKLRVEEMERELASLKESVKEFEKRQIY